VLNCPEEARVVLVLSYVAAPQFTSLVLLLDPIAVTVAWRLFENAVESFTVGRQSCLVVAQLLVIVPPALAKQEASAGFWGMAPKPAMLRALAE
jgi:hypothetical protein